MDANWDDKQAAPSPTADFDSAQVDSAVAEHIAEAAEAAAVTSLV